MNNIPQPMLKDKLDQPTYDLLSTWKSVTKELDETGELDWLSCYIFQDLIMRVININCDEFVGFNKFSNSLSLSCLRTQTNSYVNQVIVSPEYEIADLIKKVFPIPFCLSQKFIPLFVDAMNKRFPELNIQESRLVLTEQAGIVQPALSEEAMIDRLDKELLLKSTSEEKKENDTDQQNDNDEDNLLCTVFFNLDMNVFLADVMPQISAYLNQHPEVLKEYERFNFKFHSYHQNDLHWMLLNSYRYKPHEVLPQAIYENQQRAEVAGDFFQDETDVFKNIVGIVNQYLGVTEFKHPEQVKLELNTPKNHHKYSLECTGTGSVAAANQLMRYLNNVSPHSCFFKTIAEDKHEFTISNQVMTHPSIISDTVDIEDFIAAQKASGEIKWSLKESISQLKLIADDIIAFEAIHKYKATRILLQNILNLIQAISNFKSIASFNETMDVCSKGFLDNVTILIKKCFPFSCFGLFKYDKKILEFIDKKLTEKLGAVLRNLNNVVNGTTSDRRFSVDPLRLTSRKDRLADIIDQAWPDAEYKNDLKHP